MALAAAIAAWDRPSTSREGKRRYEELYRAVEVARAYLSPRDINHPHRSSKSAETPEVTEAFALLTREGRADEVFYDFITSVEDGFHLVQRDINQRCTQMKSTSGEELQHAMKDLLDRLALWQRTWGTRLKVFNDPRRVSQFTSTFHQLLHSSLPAEFPDYLRECLVVSLSQISQAEDDPAPAKRKIVPPSPHFSRLGILPRYSTTLSRVAHDEVERIAQEESAKGWDVRLLSKARKRVGEGVAGWLHAMFEGNEAAQSALRPMFSRLDYNLCKCFFEIRTDELFDIIVDYPESLAALEDLKECLYKVDRRDVLVDKLNASNRKRLLHPGAETKDVITQYISTIRCLRILDPPGVLLHKIAEPIRKHLRDRPDTIKCIVAFLVEGEELLNENEMQPAGMIGSTGEDEAENFGDPKWEPEPVDAAPEFRSGKAGDIISTLVSIYETREVIIEELQVLLASRLLAVKDYDAVREIRTIEMLKIRFGETALQVCDVMLKDMADSKRIDDHVHGDISSSVHPLVISRMFWPNVQSSSLHLTPKLERAAKEYEAAFHHFKPDKHLRWLQHLGTVTISLEMSDRIVEVEATTLQASTVELFEGKTEWTIVDLCEALGVKKESVVRAGLTFWVGEGVLREQGDVWVLIE